jgi:hypothetical protein
MTEEDIPWFPVADNSSTLIWTCFERMQFLRSALKSRRTWGNIPSTVLPNSFAVDETAYQTTDESTCTSNEKENGPTIQVLHETMPINIMSFK